jgi:hypothetical protein
MLESVLGFEVVLFWSILVVILLIFNIFIKNNEYFLNHLMRIVYFVFIALMLILVNNQE